jgi:predicted double-glycine peptidase
MILIDKGSRLYTFFAGTQRDCHTVLVRATDKDYIFASEPEIANIRISR